MYCSIEIPIVAIKHIYKSIKPGCFGLLKALRLFDKEQHIEAGCMAKRKKTCSRFEISVYFQLSARKAHRFDDYLNVCRTFVKSWENSIMYKLLKKVAHLRLLHCCFGLFLFNSNSAVGETQFQFKQSLQCLIFLIIFCTYKICSVGFR